MRFLTKSQALRRAPSRLLSRIFLVLLATAVVGGLAAGRGAGQTNHADQPDGQAILGHLNRILDWYRLTKTQVALTGLPSDAIYQSDVQNLAAKAVQLAFQSAKAEAALIPEAQTPAAATGAGAPRQNTETLLNATNARIAALQAQIGDLNGRMGRASRSQTQGLAAQKDQLQGELDLRNAMRATLEQALKSSSVNGDSSAEGLSGAIGQLERSVPELDGAGPPPAKAATAQQTTDANSRGLIGNVVASYDQLESMHQITQLTEETDQVRKTAVALRTPLQATLRATLQQGQQMANGSGQGAPGGAGTPSPVATRQQFDTLTQKFKQLADATLPLTQELTLLDQIQSDLTEWRESIASESRRAVRSVLLRVVGIAIAIAIVLLLSEIWRRVTFRYISDIRRRRQFLLVRRIVIAFAMGVVLILGFVSEFSSLATFAGFITAGLAVGLQTILLSVAAYFFLVGRWGIRVGDRISVAGVTGDVVDVGLVRLYLMELAGTGVDIYPTGRIVVFANSVLFQATIPLFKQIPGTEYTWHEVSVTLNPSGNLKLAEERLLAAVLSVYEDYRQELARQHGDVERRIEIPIKMPEPHAQLRFTDTGLEYVVRYPVGLDSVAEVDGRVTREVLQLTEHDEELKTTLSGHPLIRAAIKG
jgi:small-conductance mechanosensitive channel